MINCNKGIGIDNTHNISASKINKSTSTTLKILELSSRIVRCTPFVLTANPISS